MFRLAQCLSLFVAIVTLGGCQVVLAPQPNHSVVVHKAGPPAHAPAHGYRHKHHSGPELRFDSGLGVYIVVGHPGIYFYDGRFLRIHDRVWKVSATLDGAYLLGFGRG